MKHLNTSLLLLLFVSFSSTAQKKPIGKLESVSGHYRDLQKFSGSPTHLRAWMDTIRYPPTEYGNSITFMIVKPFYLSSDEVRLLNTGLIYPAHSSDQVRKELDYLLDLQVQRTAEQVKRVEFLGNIGYWPQTNLLPSHINYHQNLLDLFFEGREVFGINCNAENFPNVSRLLQGVMQDMRVMEFSIKYKFLRPRPYHLETKLNTLAKINSPSFASGHTLWGFLQAFIWSEIIPEKRNAFINLAEEIRRSREIMGIHYPSDNEASRQIAYKMLLHYFKNDTFKNDFKEAISEWMTNSKKYIR